MTWTCPHGFATGFAPVPGEPNLIVHRSCGICCEEIAERITPIDRPRYLITGRGPSIVWFTPRFDPKTWVKVSTWPEPGLARDAVARYLAARITAKAIGVRL